MIGGCILTDDCASRGGCYARKYGYYKRRTLSSQRKRGHGHCTVECRCCIRDRGFELTEEEKEQNRQYFEDLLWDRDASYALNMAVGHFWDVITDEDQASEDTKPNPPASSSSTSQDPPPPHMLRREILLRMCLKISLYQSYNRSFIESLGGFDSNHNLERSNL
jgi:hypothetical protein